MAKRNQLTALPFIGLTSNDDDVVPCSDTASLRCSRVARVSRNYRVLNCPLHVRRFFTSGAKLHRNRILYERRCPGKLPKPVSLHWCVIVDKRFSWTTIHGLYCLIRALKMSITFCF